MKFKAFLLFICVIGVVAMANAQTSFNHILRHVNAPVLTTICGGDVGIPDSTSSTPSTVKIYRDTDHFTCAGPAIPLDNPWWATYTPGKTIHDAAINPTCGDTLAPLCSNAPTCGTTSAYNYKYTINSMPFNGVAQGQGPGKFIGLRPFRCTANAGTLGYKWFFLVAYYGSTASGKVAWVSAPFEVVLSTSQTTLNIDSWTCVTIESAVPPCVPTLTTTFNGVIPTPRDPVLPIQKDCATICPGTDHTICIGPLMGPDRVPTVTVTDGCDAGNTACDVTCTPAHGYTYAVAGPWNWVYKTLPAPGYYYCKTITWPLEGTKVGGCVCIKLESILPVTMGTHEVAGLDNSVKVSWKTMSETNVESFIVKRNGAVVHVETATNNATGHDYSWVDAEASNGTTYNYALVIHSADGTEDVAFTESVTPSLMNALVTEYALRQNYPNPFNPTTNIIFDVKNTNNVTLKVYNAAGQEVTTLVNGSKEGGKRYSVTFDANNLPSGLYFYSIKVGNEFSATKKMLLVK